MLEVGELPDAGWTPIPPQTGVVKVAFDIALSDPEGSGGPGAKVHEVSFVAFIFVFPGLFQGVKNIQPVHSSTPSRSCRLPISSRGDIRLPGRDLVAIVFKFDLVFIPHLLSCPLSGRNASFLVSVFECILDAAAFEAAPPKTVHLHTGRVREGKADEGYVPDFRQHWLYS
jgi:hypothetical protein